MLFQLNDAGRSIAAVRSNWNPTELELEQLLVAPSDDASVQVLSEAVFGEPLLLLSNQVRTRAGKKADILALDRAGNAVIVELKRDFGQLGVETQALQYLADFSAYRGEQFLAKFAPTVSKRDAVLGFLGNESTVADINKVSRIILVARAFDETVFSLGEWLSSKGVAFRCVVYTPLEAGGFKYLSFSVVFDRSPESLFRLVFSPSAREPGYFWHNIARADESWWRRLVAAGQIPACFDDSPGDQGERILTRYVAGDVVLAYAKGFGAVGWGEITSGSTYKLLQTGDKEDFLGGECLHRLRICWKATAKSLSDGMPADMVRNEFGIYHPISTSVSINEQNGKRLVDALSKRFGA